MLSLHTVPMKRYKKNVDRCAKCDYPLDVVIIESGCESEWCNSYLCTEITHKTITEHVKPCKICKIKDALI